MSPLSGSVVGYRSAAAAAYAGPGDVVSGSIGWWGLRAYSLASVGTNAIRLRRDSDNAESDFVTVTGGGLDTTSITTFKGAANLFVTKLYDQSGNGFDVAQTTAAAQPSFTLSGLGSLPITTFTQASSQYLIASSNFSTTAQPLIASVVERGTVGNSQFFGNFDNANVTIIDDTFANTQITIYAGSIVSGSPVANGYLALQVLFNGASSSIMANGSTVSPGNPGAGSMAAGRPVVGTASFGGFMGGNFLEGGWWAGDQSASFTALTNQQRSYWGF